MDGAWAKLFGAFFDALGWVMEVFGLLGPLWLVVFFVMSIYQVMYRYAFLTLIAPVDTRFELLDPESTNITNAKGIGIAIIVILGFFKVHWVGSWLMALLITWVGDKHWQSATEGRLIEQGSGHPHDDVCVWEPNHRPRVCPVCERESSDRVYHCTRTDRCLPIYDHHCDWLQVSVYSRTMKSYLYTLLFLPLDTIGTFITLIVDLSSPTGKVDWPFGVSVLFTFTALIVGLALFGPKQWKHLAFRNEVFFEYRRPTKPILLGFKDARDARHPTLIFQLFVGNPWDRGTKRNLCQVLGSSWWMWLFFWVQPKRVSKYGQYQPGIDLPFSDKVWELRQKVLDLAAPSDNGREMEDWGRILSRTFKKPRAERLRRSERGSSSTHGEGPSNNARRRTGRTED